MVGAGLTARRIRPWFFDTLTYPGSLTEFAPDIACF